MESRLVFPVSTPPISPWYRVLCGERGWAHRSAMNLDVYCRKLDVINRGLSGFNTEWAIPVFEQVSWVDVFDQGARNAELNDQRL